MTTGSQKAVEKFEKKYPDAIISAKVEELKARNSEISDKLIPSKIPQSQEFSRLITEARD